MKKGKVETVYIYYYAEDCALYNFLGAIENAVLASPSPTL